VPVSARYTGQPESYYHGEGRVALTDSVPRFQYKLTDHLGNTMVLFEDKDGDGIITTESMSTDPAAVEVLQRNFYYAFGLPMQGPWNHAPADPDMPYLYNGKELEGELGLGWMDYGARRYDAAIGRWGGVDPLAHLYYGWSSYNYVLGNPISFVDPDGRSVEDVIITGERAQDAFRELQAGSSLTLSMDQRTGKLSASGTASNPADEKLLQAINDKSTRVVLTATNDRVFTDKTGDRSYLAPGGYGGSEVENYYSMYLLEDGTPQIAVSKVTASQFVNLNAAKIIAAEIGESVGQTLIHEVNEAYIGAKIDPGGDYSTGYNRAHNAASRLDVNNANHIKVVPLPGGVGVENTNTGTTKRIY
jgi:RHS repeat-associated protein